MTDKKIVSLLTSRSVKGWTALVEKYSDLVYSTIYYEVKPTPGERDLVPDIYLFVMSHLREKDYSGFGFRCKFSTWLTVVVRNLITDYYRSQYGRRNLPKYVQNLSLLEQRVFILYYRDGYFDSFELFDVLRNEFPEAEYSAVKMTLDNLEANLGSALRERYVSEGAGDREVALDALFIESPVDPISPADPQEELIQRDNETRKIKHLQIMRRALRQLSFEQRTLLVLRFYKDMPVPEIAGKLGVKNPKRLYYEIEKALKKLKYLFEKMD
ncbi:sigma-70 family RNA polymerase sigma factor [bacterium]|nr:sigma-70 family RNA polymerase sigma factor [bacterium]